MQARVSVAKRINHEFAVLVWVITLQSRQVSREMQNIQGRAKMGTEH
jgi:hypothetical protein